VGPSSGDSCGTRWDSPGRGGRADRREIKVIAGDGASCLGFLHRLAAGSIAAASMRHRMPGSGGAAHRLPWSGTSSCATPARQSSPGAPTGFPPPSSAEIDSGRGNRPAPYRARNSARSRTSHGARPRVDEATAGTTGSWEGSAMHSRNSASSARASSAGSTSRAA
jgi:hypothetical protein